MQTTLSCLEICAGAGGQSLGLEQAGYEHELAVEIEPEACNTLRSNRPSWKVYEGDVRAVSGSPYRGIDLLAGGVPCPPFSVAGKQLGADDERDLFPEALRLVAETRPAAVLLENVRGFSSAKFEPYRSAVQARLRSLGYVSDWRVLNASEYGLAQLRPRFVLVALRQDDMEHFIWPTGDRAAKTRTVGKVLHPEMSRKGWSGAADWASKASGIGPTIVGGSRKHGGPDLGPTRAREAWLRLGVDGRSIANDVPTLDTPRDHIPRLTLEMVAKLQGFPPDWKFSGKKTSAYRQIGNAFPPPVACAVGKSIAAALRVSQVDQSAKRSTRTA